MPKISIFDAASKEIEEEMNISADMYDNFSLIGSFINQTCNVCFVFYLKINLEEKEIHNLFAQQHDSEVEKLIFVEKHKLKSFVLKKIGMNTTILDIFNLAT